MALSDMQLRPLRAKLDARHIRTRKANGTDLHYVEGWHVISEANRIFGYDAWDRRTVATKCVSSSGNGQHHFAAYTAKVRITVRAGDIIIVREGSGTGEGSGLTPGQSGLDTSPQDIALFNCDSALPTIKSCMLSKRTQHLCIAQKST